MSISNARRLAACVALFVSFTQAASAADILTGKHDGGAGRRGDRRQRQLAVYL